MKWMSVVLVTALLVQIGYLPCAAQVTEGARVRIKAPSVSKSRLTGTVVTVDADTLMLRSEKQVLAISLASVLKLEVSQGRKARTIGRNLKAFRREVLPDIIMYIVVLACDNQ